MFQDKVVLFQINHIVTLYLQIPTTMYLAFVFVLVAVSSRPCSQTVTLSGGRVTRLAGLRIRQSGYITAAR